jgi:hypothetical protein
MNGCLVPPSHCPPEFSSEALLVVTARFVAPVPSHGKWRLALDPGLIRKAIPSATAARVGQTTFGDY